MSFGVVWGGARRVQCFKCPKFGKIGVKLYNCVLLLDVLAFFVLYRTHNVIFYEPFYYWGHAAAKNEQSYFEHCSTRQVKRQCNLCGWLDTFDIQIDLKMKHI